MARVRPPEEIRIPLEGDEWLLVKKHLTWGEKRHGDVFVYRNKAGGGLETDPEKIGLGLALVYLLDWSLPFAIRGADEATLLAALQNLDPEQTEEIIFAVLAHDTAMRELREAEKKTATNKSPLTSGSVA